MADKPLYQVGDTAKVLVPHPFSGPVEALLTIERGEILEAQVITIDGNSETLEIPITEEHVPNVFVSVALVKGEDDGQRRRWAASSSATSSCRSIRWSRS